MMKRFMFSLARLGRAVLSAAGLVLIIASCAPTTTVTPLPTITLDTTGPAATSVKASAVVVPVQESHLSFVISGLVEEVLVKEGDQVTAGQALMRLDTAEQQFAVSAAEFDLRAAEIDAALQRVRRKYVNRNGKTVYLSGPREKLAVVDAKVDQKQAELDAAKASLTQGTLATPFDGTVVEVDVSPGEYVQPAQAVIVIADLRNLQIETTDLSELNVAAVKIGQPAAVFVEALNQNFPGKVTVISPISNKIGGDMVFKVTIKLDEQPQDLLWGMSADVDINVK
jgi:RND family efflux transporter MFP subunit